jgi:hypothetical protein
MATMTTISLPKLQLPKLAVGSHNHALPTCTGTKHDPKGSCKPYGTELSCKETITKYTFIGANGYPQTINVHLALCTHYVIK